MAAIWNGYLHLLKVATLPTQMVTAALTMGSGNVIAQHFVEKKSFKDMNWMSTTRLAGYGGIFFAPILNRWFLLLHNIPIKNMILGTAARVGLDMMVFAPFTTAAFLSIMGVLEGRRTDEVKQRLERAFWPVLMMNWRVFPPAAVINQTIIPLYARPPFINLVSLGWGVYLASMNQRTNQEMTAAPISIKTEIALAAAELED